MPLKRISVDPLVCHGQPCVKGTRIPVHQIVRSLANGDTVENLIAEYPALSREDILACLRYAAELSENLEAKVQVRYQEVEEARRQLTNLPAMLVQVHETERRLLARELHDDLTQELVALSMEAAELSKASLESPDVIHARIRDLGQKIGRLADDVHLLSRQLHPAILDDLGLEAALREECLSAAQRLGIAVRFKAEDVPRTLPADTALCLLRVAQESLRNIGKHAGAKEVRVLLARHKTDLVLLVEDIGNGFDIEQAREKRGLGLLSMEERVRLVNGNFEIRSQPGKGTEVEVHVPLPEAAS
jgi:signal transduction histidine kinase